MIWSKRGITQLLQHWTCISVAQTHIYVACCTFFFLFFSLNDLAEFIKVADSGLQKPVEEGDYDGLVEVMGHLMAVKDRQATTDEMFEPLKQTIELLKTYDQEMPEEVHQQLQVHENYWCYHVMRSNWSLMSVAQHKTEVITR